MNQILQIISLIDKILGSAKLKISVYYKVNAAQKINFFFTALKSRKYGKKRKTAKKRLLPIPKKSTFSNDISWPI